MDWQSFIRGFSQIWLHIIEQSRIFWNPAIFYRHPRSYAPDRSDDFQFFLSPLNMVTLCHYFPKRTFVGFAAPPFFLCVSLIGILLKRKHFLGSNETVIQYTTLIKVLKLRNVDLDWILGHNSRILLSLEFKLFTTMVRVES